MSLSSTLFKHPLWSIVYSLGLIICPLHAIAGDNDSIPSASRHQPYVPPPSRDEEMAEELLNMVNIMANLPPAKYEISSSQRLLVFGDLEGRIEDFQKQLEGQGLINDQDHWCGGDAVVVTAGDTIDGKGNSSDDRRMIDYLVQLDEEAQLTGGRVLALFGNHEELNVRGNFRYTSRPRDLLSFEEFNPGESANIEGGRRAAFAPGGEYAKKLAKRNCVMIIGNDDMGWYFITHAGLRQYLVAPLDTTIFQKLTLINQEVALWVAGYGDMPHYISNSPQRLAEDDCLLWTRVFSRDESPSAGYELSQLLHAMGAKAMLVGHQKVDNIQVRHKGMLILLDAFTQNPETNKNCKYYYQCLEICGSDTPKILGLTGPL